MELKKVLQIMSIEHKTHRLSSRALAHLDGLLDEALEQTFPASDAVAIDIERGSHDTEVRVLDSRTLLAGNRKVGQRTAQKH
jgi:ketosteroid isomerase-like protein